MLTIWKKRMQDEEKRRKRMVALPPSSYYYVENPATNAFHYYSAPRQPSPLPDMS